MEGTELQSAIRGLGAGVALIALFLGLRQWYESQARGELSEIDGAFHGRQAVRRWIGVAVMGTLAALVSLGSWVEPRVEGKGNPAFVALWMAIMALIAVVLGVALWDSVATWLYARDRRREMVRDHVDELRRHMRSAADARRDQAGGDESSASE
jgi:hypothetical protein